MPRESKDSLYRDFSVMEIVQISNWRFHYNLRQPLALSV